MTAAVIDLIAVARRAWRLYQRARKARARRRAAAMPPSRADRVRIINDNAKALQAEHPATRFQDLTLDEYQRLDPPDPNTVYIIKGKPHDETP